MKFKKLMLTAVMLFSALLLVAFSHDARQGAVNGLALAQNTIIPSLLPLLIIFYFIIKSSMGDMLNKGFGFISAYIFNLPYAAFSAILFAMTGGYPTGALLIQELLDNGSIDKAQARQMLRFNVCGGCGFIITAVGSALYGSTKTGIILLSSNVLSNFTIGFLLSFSSKRTKQCFYSYRDEIDFAQALTLSTQSAIRAALNITAYIMLFCAFNEILKLPEEIIPVIEITSGICNDNITSLPAASAFLAFGGLCIHLQLMPVIMKAEMNYFDFMLFRAVSALLSYVYTKLLLLIFPVENYVFSNLSSTVTKLSSVNIMLSVLMAAGCFIIIGDIYSKSIVRKR